MPLPKPREGEILGFHAYPVASEEFTLGNPETITWSSIRHLCSRSAGEWYAMKAHGISNRRKRAAVARNLQLYIQQASEFYQAASNAKPNTAPLIYYYSFLNLAKALCELRIPQFHQSMDCYAHGLSWKPDTRKLVNFPRERVTIRGRGVWQVLWECLTRKKYPAVDRCEIPVRKLFSYCPEISAEFRGIFGSPLPTIDIKDPDLSYDEGKDEAWLRFSIERDELRRHKISARALIAQMSGAGSSFVEVTAANKSVRSFESRPAKTVGRGKSPWFEFHTEILDLNLIAHFGREPKLEYSFPLQETLPIRLPQLMVGYTILFWLGSLVRYDPHSVHALMDSQYWILIDGFMTQSRVWMLELFEWSLYQTETTLRTAR